MKKRGNIGMMRRVEEKGKGKNRSVKGRMKSVSFQKVAKKVEGRCLKTKLNLCTG